MSRTQQRDLNAGVFEKQVVIQDTSVASSTGGALYVKRGKFKPSNTFITGHIAVNDVKITPNLNDIIVEKEAILLPGTIQKADVSGFAFDNAVTSAFKAYVSVQVETQGVSKTALWELYGWYSGSEWDMTSFFSGDLTGVEFSIASRETQGQVQYTNTNAVGSTTFIRFRANTTGQLDTQATDSIGLLTNTSGSYIKDRLLYSSSTTQIGNTNIVYKSNALELGTTSSIILQGTDTFVSFSNGGTFTSMGDGSVAKDLYIGTKMGINNTAPVSAVDVNGSINLTGNVYTNGTLYNPKSAWEMAGIDIFTTSGNVGIFTTNPQTALDVSGTVRVSGALTTGTLITTTADISQVLYSSEFSTGQLRVSGALHAPSASVGSIVSSNSSIGSLHVVNSVELDSLHALSATVDNLRADALTGQQLSATNATIANVHATTLTTVTASTETFTFDSIRARNAISTSLNAAGMTASSLNATSVSSASMDSSSLTAGHLTSTNITAGSFTPVSATTSTLVSDVNAVSAGSLVADTLKLDVVNATNSTFHSMHTPSFQGTTANFTATNAPTLSTGNIFVSGDAQVLGRITATSVTSSNIQQTTLSTGSITATNATIGNITASNFTTTNATVGSGLFATGSTLQNIEARNVIVTNALVQESVTSGTLSFQDWTIKSTNGNIAISYSGGSKVLLGDTIELEDSLAAKSSSNTIGPLITTNGSVGLGTASPQATLQIVQNTSDALSIVNDTENGIGAGFAFSLSTLGSPGAAILHERVGKLHFATSSTSGTTKSRLTIAESGYVGIGTTSPTHQLTVAGATVADSVDTNSASLGNLFGGSVTVGNHIVPDDDETVDLGSPSMRWRDLYLSSSSFFLGDNRFSLDSTGNLVIPTNLVINGNVNGVSLQALKASTTSVSKHVTTRAISNWTLRYTNNNNWKDLTWAAELGLFVAVADSGSGNRVMTSADGLTWNTKSSAADADWQSVAWSPELDMFAAVATNSVMTSPNGIDWTTRTSPASASKSLVWANTLGMFVAVGNSVMSSLDGLTWTTQSAPSQAWQSVEWANDTGLLVAVANEGAVMTSTDGITWTTRTSGVNVDLVSVAWSEQLGIFVAVSNTGDAITSPDGINWTTQSTGGVSLSDVSWSGELACFVAVGTNSVVTSSDGMLWTSRACPNDASWKAIAYAPELGIFAAVSSNGNLSRAMTSEKAKVSSANAIKTLLESSDVNQVIATRATHSIPADFNGIVWSEELGLFVATSWGSGLKGIMTSRDAITWATRSTPVNNQWQSPVWAAELGLFVTVGGDGAQGNKVLTSTDGITWVSRTTSASSWKDIAWSPELGLFAAVAYTGSDRVMTSPDGVTWTTRTNASSLEGITWSKERGLFVAVGGSGSNCVSTSSDGIQWTTRSTPNTASVWRSVTYAADLGIFVAVGESVTVDCIMTSSDGITWTMRQAPVAGSYSSVTWSPELGRFAAVSYSGGANSMITSPDGVEWTAQSTDNHTYHDIAWSPKLGVLVAIAFSGAVMITKPAPAGAAGVAKLRDAGLTLSARSVEVDGNVKSLRMQAATLTAQNVGVSSATVSNIAATNVTTGSLLATSFSSGALQSSSVQMASGRFTSVTSESVEAQNVTVGALSVASTVSTTNLISTFATIGNLSTSMLTTASLSVTNAVGVNLNLGALDSPSLFALSISSGNVNVTGDIQVRGSLQRSIDGLLNVSGNLVTGRINNVDIAAVDLRSKASLAEQSLAVSTWTNRFATSNTLSDVAWSPELGLFAAISDSGILTSPDTIMWTTRSSANENTLTSIVWSPELSLFVAVCNSGNGNRVMTSANGATWVSRASAADNDWQSVAWSTQLGVFVAVSNTGTGNRVMTSSDGTVWTTRATTDSNWSRVIWADTLGMFVAVGNNAVMTSPDGLTWTIASVPSGEWSSLVYSTELGTLAAVSSSSAGNSVITSSDGISWTTRLSNGQSWRDIAWSADLGVFVAVGERPAQQEFPPAALTENVTVFSGYSDGNGSYSASASTVNSSGWAAWYAFDKDPSHPIWESAVDVYSISTGLYTGAVSTVAGQTTYSGEWIQLQLPTAVPLTSFKITPRGDFLSRAPRSFVILGSNDSGSSWSFVHEETNVIWTTASSKTITTTNTTSYSRYRLVVRQTTANPVLDQLSIAGRSAARGAYALYRVSSTYTGPTIRLRRSTDNVQQDFYANADGVIGTGFDGTGTLVSSWLGAATGFVVTWYDQSGSARHATQATTSAQPVFSSASLLIDFQNDNARFLNIPSDTVPVGVADAPYTIIARHGTANNTSGGIVGSGSNNLRLGADTSVAYVNSWTSSDYGFGATEAIAPGNKVTIKFDGTNRTGYVNGASYSATPSTGSTNAAGQQYIGKTESNAYLNGQLYFVYIFGDALGDDDRTHCENTTVLGADSRAVSMMLDLYSKPFANCMTSRDASSWTTRSVEYGAALKSVEWAPELNVFCTLSNNDIITSRPVLPKSRNSTFIGASHTIGNLLTGGNVSLLTNAMTVGTLTLSPGWVSGSGTLTAGNYTLTGLTTGSVVASNLTVNNLVSSSATAGIMRLTGSGEMPVVLDSLSSGGRTAARGAYALVRLSMSYTGPTIRLRRSTDNVEQDFYANSIGGFGTELDGTGTSLTTWLGAATAFVRTWYDQSGTGNHATQTTTSAQPLFNHALLLIDFQNDNARFLNIPSNTVPVGVLNAPYTFVARHGIVNNTTDGELIGAGVTGTANQSNSWRVSATNDVAYYNYWWANDYGFGTTSQISAGNRVSLVYNGTARQGFINGASLTAANSTGINTAAGQQYLGRRTDGTRYLNGQLHFVYIFGAALNDADRILCEGTGTVSNGLALQVAGNNVMEFGFGVAGKNVDAGKIGYQQFSADSLDVVGATNEVNARGIQFWEWLGVGATPRYPLEISGGVSTTFTSGSYFNNEGTNTSILTIPTSGSTRTVSIRTNQSVRSHGCIAASDERIKTDVKDIDDNAALIALRAIEPKRYKYIDTVNRGNASVWGFSAQQVKSVLNHAVNIQADYVPNVYQLATVENSNVLAFAADVAITSPCTLKVFDAQDQEYVVHVESIIDARHIQVSEELLADQVFVYGEYIDDFHTLKKDAIFTIAVAALQETHKQLIADREKTEQLEIQVQQFEDAIIQLQQRASNLS